MILEDNGEMLVFANELESLYHVQENLLVGKNYQFKIQAKNVIEYGEYSDILEFFAGEKPSRPEKPSTQIKQDNLLIYWT